MFYKKRVIEIFNKSFLKLISQEEIQAKIKSLATQINKEYEGRELLFIGVLDGSFMFLSDLLKHITLSCKITFVKLKSYEGMESNGLVRELVGLDYPIDNKNILILEDIIDTGKTMDYLIHVINKNKPLSIAIATLFFKPTKFLGNFPPTYTCFSISDSFIVGYGLDYEGYGRNLTSIYQHKGNTQTLPLC